jgi:hypothetical protein
MNDRIRELALQVDLMRYPSDSINIRIEKFAELIVKECAKRCEELGQPEIGLGILKHFGIEKF